MDKEIILRKLQLQDYEPLQNIIRKTWKFERFCSFKIARRLSKAYLASCLVEKTFAMVVEADEKAVGVIMGKNIRKQYIPVKYFLYALGTRLTLMLSAEGRGAVRALAEMEEINNDLLKKCDREYEGELSFFIIDEAYRGMGLGKRLFKCFMQYIKDENIHNYYLFTDTECNFGFYERQGLIRRNETIRTFESDKESWQTSFFVYDYES